MADPAGASGGGPVLAVSTTPVFLPADAPLRRLPRKPGRKRPQAFLDALEDRALYYDGFFYGDAGDVLLIGPPPHNLAPHLQAARYRALPSGAALEAELFPSRSTMITALRGAPPGTVAVGLEMEGLAFEIALQPDLSPLFSGRNILFTINKDNRLDWIALWADWHARMHGTDAVILFDNGSTAYGIADIERVLAAVPGLRRIAVVSVPHKFGPVDKWVAAYHYWPRFLQISATGIALRRFGMAARGIVNCDIDELMWAGDRSVYDLACEDRLGALRLRGRWIEAARAAGAPEPADHLGFRYRLKDIRARLSASKCVLDPGRDWVKALDVHPYLHRIHRAPLSARFHNRAALFWHFKGINTNWKQDRALSTEFDPRRHTEDAQWLGARAAYFARGGAGAAVS